MHKVGPIDTRSDLVIIELMPAKYRLKDYKVDSYYHIYSKGIDGRKIFEDEEDYLFFERLMETYTSDAEPESGPYKQARPSMLAHKKKMSLMGNVEIGAYCLMPDHYHILVHQRQRNAITQLMRRINTAYVMYFNRKYRRKGTLFEGNYKAVRIDDETALVYLSKFIHLNPVSRVVKRFGPVETVMGTRPEEYLHSSYNTYIGTKHNKWIYPVPGTYDTEKYRRFSEDVRESGEKYLKDVTIDVSE